MGKMSLVCIFGILMTTTIIQGIYAQTSDNYLYFKDDKSGLEMRYPPDWNIDQTSYSEEERLMDIVQLWSPDQTALFLISMEYPIILASAEEIGQLQADLAQTEIDNFKLIESNSIVVSGKPAWQLTYVQTLDSDELTITEIYIVENNAIYTISYTTYSETYYDYLPTFNLIKDTIQINSNEIPSKNYENTEHKFKIKYPANWIKTEEGLPEYCRVQLFSQGENIEDQFSENITICTQEIPNDMTLEKYVEELKNGLKQEVLKIENIESESTQLDNVTSYRIVYTATYRMDVLPESNPLFSNPFAQLANSALSEQITLKQMGIGTIKNGVAYSISYGAEPEKFSDFLPAIEKIINSFEFTDKSEELISSVPVWIKNNAGWWSNGEIDDKTFISGIQFLIKEKIIHVSLESQKNNDSDEIPGWIKGNAGWWADGQIDDTAFIQGIEYMVNQGIIKVS